MAEGLKGQELDSVRVIKGQFHRDNDALSVRL